MLDLKTADTDLDSREITMNTTLEPVSVPPGAPQSQCKFAQWADWALKDIQESLEQESRVAGIHETAKNWISLVGLMRRTQDRIRSDESRQHERPAFLEICAGLVISGEMLAEILNQISTEDTSASDITPAHVQATVSLLKLIIRRWQVTPSEQLVEEFNQKCLSGAA